MGGWALSAQRGGPGVLLKPLAVVLANAALALAGTGKYANYEEAYQAAVRSLESGAAIQSLETLIALQP